MKATMVSPVGGRMPPTTRGIFIAGDCKDFESKEIAIYLSKLRDLVPHVPRNRKLSKLEVIQHVIQYIYELERALENDKHHHHQTNDIEDCLQEVGCETQLIIKDIPRKR